MLSRQEWSFLGRQLTHTTDIFEEHTRPPAPIILTIGDKVLACKVKFGYAPPSHTEAIRIDMAQTMCHSTECGRCYLQKDGSSQPQSKRRKRATEKRVQLLALDMDGTLLNSSSRVDPSSVEALHAALATGVKVCLATGKARPAALNAMRFVGLAGPPPPPPSLQFVLCN